MSRRRENIILIAASLLFAGFLTIIPLPDWAVALRPYWVALVLIYWVLETDAAIHLGTAFLIGLGLDVLAGSLLGQHALSLVVLTYLLGRFRARIRFFPPWQQALAVFALLLNDRIIHLWIIALVGEGLPGWGYWLAPLVGTLAWPWLFLLLDELRRRARARSS